MTTPTTPPPPAAPKLPSDGEPVSEFLRNLATTMRRTGQSTMARCVDEAASAFEMLSARATTLDKNCTYLREKRDQWRQSAHSKGLENKALAAERDRLRGLLERAASYIGVAPLMDAYNRQDAEALKESIKAAGAVAPGDGGEA